MNSIVFLVLRRVRAPLLALISVYAVAILGLTLIPGQDTEGTPWRMDFFHAFYFVSYMATTIGFGEIPYPLTPAQRLWVVTCIYLTVVAWLYAIGMLLGLMQDKMFRAALTQRRFRGAVRRIRHPFFIVCGHGDTGGLLVKFLVNQRRQAVVLDRDPECINALRLAEYPLYVPGLNADVSRPENLKLAGLTHPKCVGVIALTNDDQVNLHIAITSKLLNPRLTVIARSSSRETTDNMASFGTDHIINPFEAFADRLFTALHSPATSILHEWLAGLRPLDEPLEPPHGRWLLCGYGRFGKALLRRFQQERIETVVIEATPEKTGRPEKVAGFVEGWGTEAPTLRQAGIENAAGIVAGTDYDTNNLSILMTAKDLKGDLFTVARQNRHINDSLFRALGPDIIAEASDTVAHRIRLLLDVPMLRQFIDMTRRQSKHWAARLNEELIRSLGRDIPEVWEWHVEEPLLPNQGDETARELTLGMLMSDLEEDCDCRILLRNRGDGSELLPEVSDVVEVGDGYLICGRPGSRGRFQQRLRWLRESIL